MKRLYIYFNLLLIVIILGLVFLHPNSVSTSFSSLAKGVPSGSNISSSIDSLEDSGLFHVLFSNLKSSLQSLAAPSSVLTDVLETQVGTMSAYGLDCKGCSGRVGAGYDARGNNVMYHDSTYGDLRIVAGDKKYPYGTVIRVVNSKIGTFNVIVLDRGGDIGIGRRYMFDLLFFSESEALQFGLSRNTTFEVLRYGY